MSQAAPVVSDDALSQEQQTAACRTSPVPGQHSLLFQSALGFFQHVATAALAQHGIAGMTLGLVLGDDLVWSCGVGSARLASADNTSPALPCRSSTVYRIASITKAFTVTAMLRLRDQGVLSLDDPVTRLVPEAETIASRFDAADVRSPTLRQLASHSGGLATEGVIDRFGSEADFPDTQAVLSSLKLVEMVYKPGTRYKYSGIGYALLGLALSRAAKMPLTAYVQQHILAPLRMDATSFVRPADMAVGYRRARHHHPITAAPTALYSEAYAPTGGLYSTVPDLARWASFHLAANRSKPCDPALPNVLHPASVREQYVPHVATGSMSSQRQMYGLGWAVGTWNGAVRKRVISHTGGTWGFVSNLVILPHVNAAFILLCNTDSGDGMHSVSKQVLAALVPVLEAAGKPAPTRSVSLAHPLYPSPPQRIRDKLLGLYERPSEEQAVQLVWSEGQIAVLDVLPDGNVQSLDDGCKLCLDQGQHGNRDAVYRIVGGSLDAEQAWFIWDVERDCVTGFRAAHLAYARVEASPACDQ